MRHQVHPGYEYHLNLYDILANGTQEEQERATRAQRKFISEYTLPDGMTMEDRVIPGPGGKTELRIRVYTPAGLPEKAPVLLEIHGGGWVGGNLDIDNYRCIYLAQHTPCIVVGVDYRLAGQGVHYPEPLLDCHAALCWVYDNAVALGVDRERIALHGTSAGGNLAAGLSLYVRDRGGPKISLAVINCAALTQESYSSTWQNSKFALGEGEDVFAVYMGGYDGQPAPYYALPGKCPNLQGFPPAYIVTAEYDPLRDESIAFAQQLLRDGVPAELVLAPRVGHGFCVVDHPLTRWVHDGICASLRRELGITL